MRRRRTVVGIAIGGLVLLACAEVSMVLAQGSALDTGLLAARERRYADAIENLQLAIEQIDDMTERARIQLVLGVLLNWNGQHEAGIAMLKRVVDYDPRLVCYLPEAGVHTLALQPELGYAYRTAGDSNAAIKWWEEYLSWRRSTSAPRVYTNTLTARRELGARGELVAPPMVALPNYGFIPSRPVGEAERLIVPAARLAEALRLECEASEDHETVTLAREGGVAMTLSAGSRIVVVDGAETEMEVAPQVIEEELWVPLRFVVEEFGYRIEWEAPARIAWVRWGASPSVVQSASPDGARIREEALEAVSARNVPQAIDLLERVVESEVDPEERAQFELLLAHFYLRASRTDDVFRVLLPLTESHPQLVASFPRQKIVNLSVWGQLAETYRRVGDINTSILCRERVLSRLPTSQAQLGMVLNDRRALGDSGALTTPPMVFVAGFIPSRPVGEAERLIVPAAKLAEALRLECEASDDHETVTLSREGGVAMTLRAGSRTAVVDGAETEMEVAPQLIEEELWVPLRFVVEEFGYRIEWEAPARIAWVRWKAE